MSLNASSLLMVGLATLSAIAIAVMVLDWLFPRLIRRASDEADPRPYLGQERREALLARRKVDPLKIIETPTVIGLSKEAQQHYWQANLRIILPLLLLWVVCAFLPPLIAAPLNDLSGAFGLPLGYYLTANGGPLMFLVLALSYGLIMAARDRALGGSQSDNPPQRQRLSRGLIALMAGLVVGLGLMLVSEQRFQLNSTTLGWVLIVLTVIAYGTIGICNRATTLDEYYVAGRRIPAMFNGLAIAADWMSAATFISLAGTLWLLGYEGLAYIIGWTGGYVLLALLLAPYLRKFGQYTIPDLIGARYGGAAIRVVAAVIAMIVSFVYLTAQVSGIGIIMSRFLGVNFIIGVILGLSAVLFCSFLGGMKAVTWTQVMQAVVLTMAYLVPVGLLAVRDTGKIIPQFAFGEVLAPIVRLEQLYGINRSYTTPFDDWTIWNFLALTLCLMCGTAGLPHILIRFYTTPTVSQARHSASWALGFILLVYLSIPAYAAFARFEILRDVIGDPITQLPTWASDWGQAGLVSINDANNDQLLQYSELRIHPDLIVLATPEIVGLPATISALIVAGGLAAALSTADGLLIVITSAVAHDIYHNALRQRESTAMRLQVGRVAMLVAATLAGLTALQQIGIIVEMVAWAFSLAASTIFPALVLGIFWKRANRYGAMSGMLAGLVVTFTYIGLNLADRSFAVLGIAGPAAGVFGMPVNFLVAIVVSLRTPPPPPEAAALIDALRRP